MRKYFVPENDDYVLVDADYSQIELRVLAAVSGDENMIRAFAEGHDIHTETAASVFGVPPDDVTPEQSEACQGGQFRDNLRYRSVFAGERHRCAEI